MKTPMIVVEGIDGVGKSSCIPHLRRILDHRAHVWERGPGSMWVYGTLGLGRCRSDLCHLASMFEFVQVVLECEPSLATCRDSARSEMKLFGDRLLFRRWHEICLETSYVNHDDGDAFTPRPASRISTLLISVPSYGPQTDVGRTIASLIDAKLPASFKSLTKPATVEEK